MAHDHDGEVGRRIVGTMVMKLFVTLAAGWNDLQIACKNMTYATVWAFLLYAANNGFQQISRLVLIDLDRHINLPCSGLFNRIILIAVSAVLHGCGLSGEALTCRCIFVF